MDSANSGSLQSSSGGDDDFDSLSALFRSSSSSSAAPSVAPAAIQLPSSSSNHHHFFDSSYLDSSSLLPFDTTISASVTAFWSRAGERPTQSVQPRDIPAAAAASTQRSSKKRSRASRRTPTTVLTTDTANFRAMVQEFTGIPSAPFAPTSRFNAFHSPAGAAFRSFAAPGAATAAPSYLLRPLGQKFQSPASFISTTSSATAAAISNMSIANADASVPFTATTTGSGTYPSGTGNNYQLHDLLVGNPHQSLLSSQSPMLTFQSVLQPHLHAKHAQPLPQTMPSISAEYGGFGRGPVASSEATGLRMSWNEAAPSVAVDRVQLRSMSGEPVGLRHKQRTNSSKTNLSALGSSSEVDADKVAETARASRGEGTLESWICSSD